jgi:hypothetical protein
LNQGRLYFLLNLVEESSDPNIFFVKKNSNNSFRSFYNNEIINLDEHVMNGLMKMMDNLAKHLTERVQSKHGFYILDIITGECMYWEYVWNGSIRDKCRHCHAAKLYKNAREKGFMEIISEAKEQLVTYFRNKERILPANLKNYVIYQGTIENAFKEIVRLYKIHGKVLLY